MIHLQNWSGIVSNYVEILARIGLLLKQWVSGRICLISNADQSGNREPGWLLIELIVIPVRSIHRVDRVTLVKRQPESFQDVAVFEPIYS